MSNNKFPYESELWVFLWRFFGPDRFSMFVPSMTDICYALLFVSEQFSTVSGSICSKTTKGRQRVLSDWQDLLQYLNFEIY